jgi:hypothetical protein
MTGDIKLDLVLRTAKTRRALTFPAAPMIFDTGMSEPLR